MPIKKEVILPQGAPKPLAPYSPAIRAGSIVYTAGQVGLDPATGKLVSSDIKDQVRQVLTNLKTILEAAGSDLSLVVKTTVLLKDISDYAPLNEVYGEFFKNDPPARTAVAVKDLPANALVEIEAVALVKDAK